MARQRFVTELVLITGASSPASGRRRPRAFAREGIVVALAARRSAVRRVARSEAAVGGDGRPGIISSIGRRARLVADVVGGSLVALTVFQLNASR